MDFFNSVFSDRSPPATPTAPRNPETTPPTSSWAFGSSLFKTLASKSESFIDNYYKDLQELGSGLKKETSVIRQAARRAVQDLPARLESGASIAQESLEAVGQAIDNVGFTVSEIIAKDLNFAANDGFLNTRFGQSDDHEESNHNRDRDLNLVGNSKPYSRIEATIRALQCDIRTYCDQVEEDAYNERKLGFNLEEKREEIDRLVEENDVIMEIYTQIVPLKVDEETFWCRYFYRVDKVVKAEEAHTRIVQKAILDEKEEELTWDFDEDDVEDGGYKSKDELKKDGEDKGKGVNSIQIRNQHNEKEKRVNEDGGGVSGSKSDVLIDEENLGEKFKHNEKDGSDGKIGSDISVISSQRSSHAEDDLGWDEIEDIRSGDESNVSNGIDLRKHLSSAVEEEELSWDIEDDDDEDDIV